MTSKPRIASRASMLVNAAIGRTLAAVIITAAITAIIIFGLNALVIRYNVRADVNRIIEAHNPLEAMPLVFTYAVCIGATIAYAVSNIFGTVLFVVRRVWPTPTFVDVNAAAAQRNARTSNIA